jgi:molecular chaperone IbpA
MRTNLDFSPYFRSSVGFDRMFNLLDEASRLTSANGVAYDIVKAGDDGYRITLAVPGFARENLELTQEGNVLIITGNVGERAAEGDVLHQGIRTRSFTQRFELADFVNVTGANLADGLLTVELLREIPDELKPRQIPIGQGTAQSAPQQIEAKAA